jgi:hypothetical protein
MFQAVMQVGAFRLEMWRVFRIRCHFISGHRGNIPRPNRPSVAAEGCGSVLKTAIVSMELSPIKYPKSVTTLRSSGEHTRMNGMNGDAITRSRIAIASILS